MYIKPIMVISWYIDSLTINDYVYKAYHGYILHVLCIRIRLLVHYVDVEGKSCRVRTIQPITGTRQHEQAP